MSCRPEAHLFSLASSPDPDRCPSGALLAYTAMPQHELAQRTVRQRLEAGALTVGNGRETRRGALKVEPVARSGLDVTGSWEREQLRVDHALVVHSVSPVRVS